MADRDRIPLLDVLRGVALFGILAVNMDSFRGAAHPVVEEVRFPGAADRLAEGVTQWLAQGKFFPLFSLLFGYGVALQGARTGAGRWGPHIARRLVGLGVIGIVHGLLAFSGDILFTYALAGALLLAFGPCRDRTLRIWALALLGASAVLAALVSVALEALQWSDGGAGGIVRSAERTTTRYRSGSFLTVTGERAVEFGFTTVAQFFAGAFTTVLAMMILGLLAARMRLFHDVGANNHRLARLRSVGLGIGLPAASVATAVTISVLGDRLDGWSAVVLLVAATAGGLAGPLLTVGYIGSIALVRHQAVGVALRLLAPAGRMALTNYLTQSLVCSLLFSGYGLGWYARVGPVEGLALCVALFGVQVVLSHVWLRSATMGPVEWVLRWFTYGQRPRLFAGNGP